MPDIVRARVVPGLLLGLAAGLLSGLFGVGGGVVLVPGLVALLALPQHAAHATSLAAIILTAAAAMQPFAADDSVRWAEAGVTAAGALLGALAGAAVMHRLSPTRLRQAFAVLVLVVAIRLLIPIEAAAPAADAALDVARGAAFAGLGLATGLLSAVMGVGGGVILVPAFVLLFGFDQHTAEGTSLAVIIPTAVMGAVRHAKHGYTDWRVGFLVGGGGILGGQVGARLALLLPGTALQVAFAVFLLIMAVRMLRSARRR